MLRYSREKLEQEDSITSIYVKAMEELKSRKLLYERFRRKLTDEELASITDEKIKVPLERYISIMGAGYFGGKAPTYKLKAFNKDKDKIISEIFNHKTNTEQEINEIEEIIKHVNEHNDNASLFFHEVLDFLVKRAFYEIYYKDRKTGEITIVKADPLETVAIWDYSLEKNLIGIYRIIQTYMANGEYQQMIELITSRGKRYYYDTPEKRKIFGTPEYDQIYKDEPLFKEKIDERQPPKWDDEIPATAVESCESLAMFEQAISLIKAYERVIQNSRNLFKYNDDAILKVIGYAPENPMIIQDEKGNEILNPARVIEDEYVLKTRVRYLNGNKEINSDIAWVEKNVNDGAIQNHKKTLIDIICLCTFCPNMTDLGFTQADNNAALEKKFFSLQQYVATFEGDFSKAQKRRWKILLGKINKEKGKSYDYRDIEVKLNRNIPSDKSTDIVNALKLRGLLPDETVINLLNLDLDAISELSKMDLQNEDNIIKNMENMKKMGQNVENLTLNTNQNSFNKDKEEITNIKQPNVKQSDTITKEK